MVKVIAMWSGPRNISTAMMRSFENRPDTAVWDEPFYAHYLRQTGLDHPLAAEIIAHGETNGKAVAARIVEPPPGGEPIYYQKHMSQHMLAATPVDWLARVQNAFLIRDPRAVAASYAAKRQDVGIEDLGIHRQLQIFQLACDIEGRIPPVLDAADILRAPKDMLVQLCRRLEIEFSDQMLAWPAGERPSDGVWARHWYTAVHASTGFEKPAAKALALSPELEAVAADCRESYEEMRRHRIKP